MALIYAPVVPASYFIAMVGCLSTYWTDKYVALRRCRKPKRLDQGTVRSVNYLIGSLGLVQVCGCRQKVIP